MLVLQLQLVLQKISAADDRDNLKVVLPRETWLKILIFCEVGKNPLPETMPATTHISPRFKMLAAADWAANRLPVKKQNFEESPRYRALFRIIRWRPSD
ncbi:hypothetical protein P9273_21135 [Mesorhizobium sp. WSM4935]|uniref:hypothetical protein n=1 Tax=Mesorhizobium sp. WSM4935 TaxID=3038547 RepID=UPI00241581D7|nr:hypothetical protein [Mesorhizobium sp. WSM4935]MDG4877609.1 hypothetical protein [Mesorhizobium sp. WSM4935]